jgi:hypothetical protein
MKEWLIKVFKLSSAVALLYAPVERVGKAGVQIAVKWDSV